MYWNWQSRQRWFQHLYEQNMHLCKDLALVKPKSTLWKHTYADTVLDSPFDTKNVVFQDTTTDAAIVWAHQNGYKNIVAMNFANRKNPGGGYVSGALAQEEDCCRCCPSLYPSLINSKLTDAHGKSHSFYPFDRKNVILTPKVKLVRTVSSQYNILNLNQNKLIDVYFVSTAAPYYPTDGFDGDIVKVSLKTTLLGPIKFFDLTTPVDNCLILGAWGCGAFENDPEIMSKYMKNAVRQYGGYYDKIIFAIPNKTGQNYTTFAHTFSSPPVPKQ